MEDTWHKRCQKKLELATQGYETMIDGLEQYLSVLNSLKSEIVSDENQQEFLAWLNGQIHRVSQLYELMDTDVTDQFIRFYDRNVRIRHWEEHRFV